MSANDTPRGRDQIIVAALIAGHTTKAVAQQAGCSEATVHRTRRRWADHISRERQANAEQTAAILLALIPKAARALNTLLDSPHEAVRLGAVRTAFAEALRWREQVATEREIADLASAVEQIRDPHMTTRPWAVS